MDHIGCTNNNRSGSVAVFRRRNFSRQQEKLVELETELMRVETKQRCYLITFIHR